MGSVPVFAVKKGDVGNAGVGEQMPADNQYVVARAALCKQSVEDLAVGAFVGVAMGVLRQYRTIPA